MIMAMADMATSTRGKALTRALDAPDADGKAAPR